MRCVYRAVGAACLCQLLKVGDRTLRVRPLPLQRQRPLTGSSSVSFAGFVTVGLVPSFFAFVLISYLFACFALTNNPQSLNLSDRVATSVDDHRQLLRQPGVGGSDAPCPRVTLGMAEVRHLDPSLARRLRSNPLPHLRALENACHRVADDERPGYDKHSSAAIASINRTTNPNSSGRNASRIKVGIAGPISAAPLSPRQLNSALLRQLVCVEGVATKVSVVKPKVVQSAHYCPATGKHTFRDYVDATDPHLGLKKIHQDGQELAHSRIHITKAVYPTVDADKNPLETEFGLCVYKDHQTITLQEMPEKAPMGQLPRSVELVLDYDLVDRIKPGDRVSVVGVYRALASAAGANGQQTSSGVFRVAVLVNHVQLVGRNDASQLHFSPHDVRTIRQLAQRPTILQTLGKSICPSIHGHDRIKQAIALQLLSGVEKNLDNGTHLRGDVNILLVGDPSTAKSQLLRAAMALAPLAVSTTGKGSSGVGLTAAVTSDPDTRERRLEAGAMVLADRGLVCVDEFDKMGENDRVAIHEAMEQQTVTIAKAGIHAQLNARCSVLAAANPVYGQYDKRKTVQENIGLPDSLLSRFDLLFVVLDQMDAEADRGIAKHVLRGHRHREARGMTGHDSDAEDDDGEDDDDHDHLDDDERAQKSVWQPQSDQTVLQHEFLRKYVHFCKTRMKPALSDEARELIAHRYAELRARQDDRTLPITARSLETVIRLATAHAKARLRTSVDVDDVHSAIDLLGFALYHDQPATPNNDLPSASPRKTPPGLTDVSPTVGAVVSEDDDEDDDHNASSPNKRPRLNQSPAESDDVKAKIWNALTKSDGMMALSDLTSAVGETDDNATNDSAGADAVSAETTLRAAVDDLVQQGRLMLTDDVLYLID